MKSALLLATTLVTFVTAPLALANEPSATHDDEGEVLTLEEGARRMGMTNEEFRQHSKVIDAVDRVQRVDGVDAGLVGIDVDTDNSGLTVLWREDHALPNELTGRDVAGVPVDVRKVAMSDALSAWISRDRPNVWVDGVTSVDWSADLEGLVVKVVAATPAGRMSDDELVKSLNLPSPIVQRITTDSDEGFTFNSRWTDAGAHNPGSKANPSGGGSAPQDSRSDVTQAWTRY